MKIETFLDNEKLRHQQFFDYWRRTQEAAPSFDKLPEDRDENEWLEEYFIWITNIERFLEK